MMYYIKIQLGGDILYKSQDNEDYKTTTIRVRKEHYDILKDNAKKDNRSTNYIINKIIIDYIINQSLNFEVDIDIFE